MKRSLLVSLVSLLLTFPLSAEELMRLHFDLDGDGRAERVVLETRPGTGESRRKVVVKVAGATYETQYIDVDVLPPALAVMRLDWQRPQHQLMLTTYDPCCCNYHFLAYRNGRLVRLRSDENQSCELPKPKGGGDIEVPLLGGFLGPLRTLPPRRRTGSPSPAWPTGSNGSTWVSPPAKIWFSSRPSARPGPFPKTSTCGSTNTTRPPTATGSNPPTAAVAGCRQRISRRQSSSTSGGLAKPSPLKAPARENFPEIRSKGRRAAISWRKRSRENSVDISW